MKLTLLAIALWVLSPSINANQRTKELQPESSSEKVSTTQQAHDERISNLVRTEIMKSRLSPKAKNVTIQTEKGVVTLRGNVPSQDDARKLAALAARVAGSGNVVNDTQVYFESK